MATLNLSFETGNVPLSRIVDALAQHNGWTAEIKNPDYPTVAGSTPTIPNPQTKAQAAKEAVKIFIIQRVRENELRIAREASEQSVTSIDLT